MMYRTAYRSISLLAATAALAVFGGLHFENASGRALDPVAPGDASVRTGTTLATTGINREAKTDRSNLSSGAAKGRTITFQLQELPSTTIALRVWETAESATSPQPVASGRIPSSGARKQVVACEGVVSVLTEVAKHLDPGRCVT